jgi:hypothetical protein
MTMSISASDSQPMTIAMAAFGYMRQESI